MKNQTLEELIEEFRKKYVQHNPGNREVPPEDYVTEDAQELEAFIKKVYEAGGEAGYERLRKYVAICPQCNDFCDLIPLDGRGNYVYECFGCQKTYKLEDVNK